MVHETLEAFCVFADKFEIPQDHSCVYTIILRSD